MTDRTPKLLVDAIQAIDCALEFVAGRSLPEYLADKMCRSAVERQLEILGEACARLARLHPQLIEHIEALRLAIGLRNRIIHGYDAVDDEVVYQTVHEDLSGLRADLNRQLIEATRELPR